MMQMAINSSVTTSAATSPTATSKAELFAQYHQALLREFTNNIRENINIRLDAVEQIVNHGLPDYFDRFEINQNVRNDIMAKIEPEIDDKTKVQHKACTKKINSIKDYKNVARNRLNRNKPKFLGNFVYGEIIFNKLYPYIYQQCTLHKLQRPMIMRYFISTLITIFENFAQFTQTKPQPIITYNTLVNENLFKSGCINLLKLYQIPAKEYETDKRKASKKKSSTKPKPAKRDKAKMAYQKIVDAMKLINTEERLSFVEVPQCIITGHDTRKNKTYQTMCITPPSFPSEQGINNDAAIFFPVSHGQYLPPTPNINAGVPVIAQNNGNSSNMIQTHFGGSCDDELSASTNSGDHDQQNVSLSDSGMSRGCSSNSSPSASNSLSIHINNINNVNYHHCGGGNNMDTQNVNVNRINGYNQHQLCQQNEYQLPSNNGQIIMDDNEHNGYQQQQLQQTQQLPQQTQDIFYSNNNNGNMVFNDEYTSNLNHNMEINNAFNFNNYGMNENMNGDNQFGAMLSGADLSINDNILSNNYNNGNGLQESFQYQAPVMNNPLLPLPSQYGHHGDNNNNVTVNRNNDNMFMDNVNNTAVSSTNIFSGFDNNSMANNNMNAFGGFDNNSISMNNINNLSTNQSSQIPTIVDEISSSSINTGYGASRGRSRTNNVSSLRYSPLALPAPRTQPVTVCNPFSYTSYNSNNNEYQVPFPFGNNNNYGY